MPTAVKMHNTTISSRPRGGYISLWVDLFKCACPYYSQGVRSAMSVQTASYLDLCVALVFLPGPYFCVDHSCGFVFKESVLGEVGGHSLFRVCLSRSHLSFGLSSYASVIFLDQSYQYLTNNIYFCLYHPH